MGEPLLTQDDRTPLVIGVGSDDAGFELKEHVRVVLASDPRVRELRDFGVHSVEDSAPYPAIALAVAERVRTGELDRAILICGTGIGMAISANKVAGVRATVAYDQYSVERSILSNDCQVLCLGAKVATPELAARIVTAWLGYRFDPLSASAAKIDVILHYEQGNFGRKPDDA
ncbi:MAG TPA: RpiB/LacA/LacB family sugar-phosphate isomerase [Acidimicrobiales bacterium]|nr:RpiB/LacA/LacB family sugar-phosphate isomerase [Acidimicrobiales bacterium]